MSLRKKKKEIKSPHEITKKYIKNYTASTREKLKKEPEKQTNTKNENRSNKGILSLILCYRYLDIVHIKSESKIEVREMVEINMESSLS